MATPTIDGRMTFAQKAINNALATESIRNALAEYGYSDKRLKEGLKLYEKVQTLHFQQMKEYGESFAATEDTKKSRQKANELYMKHMKLARIIFNKDPYVFNALQLSGSRHQSNTGWLRQAKAFYNNVLSDKKLMTGLALLGITAEKLKEGQALVEDFEKKLNIRDKESGEAQRATLLRDQALDEMNVWMSDFIKVSRIALQESPQDMEILGVVVKR